MVKNLKGIKRIAIVLAVIMAVSLGLSGCGDKSEESDSAKLNLYTWADMFPQEVLDQFEEETGIEINYVNFDTDETMLAKLETAKGGDYDLVIADDYIIETVIERGLAQELNIDQIENHGNINPVYQGQFYDPEDAYTIPYGAGVQTIVYDPNAVDIEIKGYSDLWDSSLENSLGIIGNYRVINGMALKVNEQSYNTEDLDEIAKAGEKLNQLAPNIRLIKDDELQNELLAGEISAGVMYTSQVTRAMLENPDLKVVYPKEGIGFGIMAGFVPVEAPNPQAAHQFLNFILDPEIGKQCFEFLGYFSTNQASDELISENMRAFLTLPADFDKDKMEMIENISAEANEKHSEIWTAFKKATGQE